MKANTVTASNKKNFPNNAIGEILEFATVPNQYYYDDKLYMDFRDRSTLHAPAGFLDVVLAPITDPATKKHGPIYKDGNVYRKNEVSKTAQEITDYQTNLTNQIIANAQSEQQELINQTLANQVVEQAQTLDDESALENQAIYPMWTFPFYYELGIKCLHFNNENELVLYKCVQPIASQEQFPPRLIPAHWTRIAPPGQILAWVQPLGSQDAYVLGDKVTHNGQTWISTHDGANVWEPGVFGWIVFTG